MKMKLLLISALSLLVYANPSWSALYKCTDANGKVSYQQQPCANNSRSSSQIEIQNKKPAGSKTSTSLIQGDWCTIYLDAYDAGEYKIGTDPTHWQESYANGEVKQNPGTDGEIWFKFTFKDDRLIHRDYGRVRMAEYQIIESGIDELILKTLYLAPDGKPTPDEYYVMKKGLCSSIIKR